MREAFTGWLGRRIQLLSRNRSPSWTRHVWKFLHAFFWGFFSFFLSLDLLVHRPFSSHLKPTTHPGRRAVTPVRASAPPHVCVPSWFCVCLHGWRDVIHAFHSRTAPKLSLRVMKAKTVVLSSHTKKIGLSSRLKSDCVCVQEKKSSLLPSKWIRYLQTPKPLWFIFPFFKKEKKVFLHVCVSVHVCVCVIVYLCACLRVCLWIEMFSYSCKKCSQLLPHSEVETDGSRWRETK